MLKLQNEDKILFCLISAGIGLNKKKAPSVNCVDWQKVFFRAKKQGVAAIAYDGIITLSDNESAICSDSLALTRFFALASKYESRYQTHVKACAGIANVFMKQGIETLILKGIGLSLYYPVPCHRPCGDIDIYLYAKEKDGHLVSARQNGDLLLSEEYGVNIHNDKHHHTTFAINGTRIENHYDFINVRSHLSNRVIETELKKYAEREESLIDESLDGAMWHRPSATFNAIFLMRHAAGHFAAIEITLRHLLDWAMFVKAEGERIDWQKVIDLAQHSGCSRFLYAINYLSVELLGLSANEFGKACSNAAVDDAQKILDAILNPTEYGDSWISRFLRWWDNRWKYRMVYRENDITSFFVLLRSHLVGPERI